MTNAITTTFKDLPTAISWSKALLEETGYTVIEKRPERLKMSDVARKFGVHAATVSRALSCDRCPDFPEKTNPRRTWITLTPDLTKFLTTRFER